VCVCLSLEKWWHRSHDVRLSVESPRPLTEAERERERERETETEIHERARFRESGASEKNGTPVPLLQWRALPLSCAMEQWSNGAMERPPAATTTSSLSIDRWARNCRSERMNKCPSAPGGARALWPTGSALARQCLASGNLAGRPMRSLGGPRWIIMNVLSFSLSFPFSMANSLCVSPELQELICS